MNTIRTRLLAAVTVLALAGLTSLGGATAAFAGPAGATLSATPQNAAPGPFDGIDIDVAFTDLSSDCAADPSLISVSYTAWGYQTGADYHSGSPSMGAMDAFDASLTQTLHFGPVGNGNSIHVEFDAFLPCLESDLTAQVDVGTTALQNYVYGYAYSADGVQSWWEGARVEGVTVDLLDAADDESAEPVDTVVTDSVGAYSFTAPWTVAADVARTYKIRFSYPDGPVVYWSGTTGATDSSPTAWADASDAGPLTWVNSAYSAVITPATGEEPPSEPTSTVVSGTVHGQTTPQGITADDYALAEGVTVDSLTDNETVFDSATTDASGYFEVGIPTGEGVYGFLRVTLPDSSVWYYRPGATPVIPSPQVLDQFSIVPGDTTTTAGYDVYAGRALSATRNDSLCSDYEDYATATFTWEYVCANSGFIGDASSRTSDRDDAFDGYGYVGFAAPGVDVGDGVGLGIFSNDQQIYSTVGDTYSEADVEGGRLYSYTDDDIWVFDDAQLLVNVDVRVDRLISGNWATWSISVYAAGTTDVLTEVPYFLLGNLGSDGETQWHGSGSVLLSDDSSSQSDPMVGHILPDGGTWSTVADGNDWISADLSGVSTVIVVLFDYCGAQPVSAAQAILADWQFWYNADLATLSACPSWSIDAPDLTVGMPYDHTFTAPFEGTGWNWDAGGSIDVSGLPDGLVAEVVDAWVDGVPPGIRIHGSPTTAGPYEFEVSVEDDWSSYDFGVAGTVADAEPEPMPGTDSAPHSLELTIDLSIGGTVEGSEATVTATGLQEGNSYTVVVHSTPQTLASDTVAVGGAVTRTVTLPALEAGWHLLTFSSTWASGGPAVARLWFQVSATGTLLATSRTDPALAYTGVDDLGGTLFLGATALLAGIAMIAVRRRRATARS